MYYDSTMILLLPAIILTLYAQSKVKSAYSKYARIPSSRGYTGSQTAREILNKNGMGDVAIEQIQGVLTDHYDPRSKVLRLSTEVYSGHSIAAAAIAAHEVGHAIQHNHGYQPLLVRNAIVPAVGFASNLSWIFIMGGMLIASFRSLIDIGIILFSITVLFQLITLPVEFNASHRALDELNAVGLLSPQEIPMGKKVLDAAALTYVAAAASAVLNLLRLLGIRGRQD